MKLASGLVALAISISSAVAVVPQWGQCGGIGYSGETECASGLVCHPYNDWYSQCIEGQAPTSTASSSISSAPPSSTPTSSATSSSSAPPTSTSALPTPTGFVGVSGTEFTLNGAKYTVVGTNSYWVGLSNFGDGDMNQAFADIAAAGGTTVRTWGFNEITTGSYWAAYYQNWSGSTPTVNLGADGLQTFDRVVAAAKANGIRLIVALTNNWSDYGGMDVYVKQILGSDNHDLFYTDPQVIAAYKSYVQTFVSRYANEPGIMAWELANEPRCRGSTGISTGTCTSATITAWAQDLSAFIKSIDSNHLVALGDEGFFNQPGHPSYPYQGSEGIDFDVNLAISTLDFGTVHAYPDHWGVTTDKTVWGNQWITDHAASMNAANKPVILEEFGILDGKPTTYASWFDTIYNSGLSGDLYWQAGSRYSWGSTHDDGYAIYPDSPEYPIIADHAADLKARPA